MSNIVVFILTFLLYCLLYAVVVYLCIGYLMRDLALTYTPLAEKLWEKFKFYVNKRFIKKHNTEVLPKFSNTTLDATKFFWKKIEEVFLFNGDVSKNIDNIFKWFKYYISKIDLNNDANQFLVFEQVKEFLNYFGFFLRKKFQYLENTLSVDKIEEYNENTIWEKIDRLISKYNYLEDPNYWVNCRHYALLFKDFFDKLKDLWLDITNHLFMEYDGWNHSWLVVTFKWKNYLVDFFVSRNTLMSSFDELPEKFFERMKNFGKDCESESLNLSEKIEYYKNDSTLYRKVCFQTADELLLLISSLIEDRWSIVVSRFKKSSSLMDKLMWVHFNIDNEWILFSNTFFYHFYPKFDEETLNSISDKNLLKEMINRIAYKTDVRKNKRNNDNSAECETIKIFDFEKKHLLKRLSYLFENKKMDYSLLRKILAGSQTESDE